MANADKGAAEIQEGLVDVLASLMADRRPPEMVEQGEGALNNLAALVATFPTRGRIRAVGQRRSEASGLCWPRTPSAAERAIQPCSRGVQRVTGGGHPSTDRFVRSQPSTGMPNC